MFGVAPVLLFGPVGLQGSSPLGAPQAIDVQVKSVQWHSDGRALLYSRDEPGGVGIGIYTRGDAGGRLLLHLQSDDRWESKWFDGAEVALVTVYRNVKSPASTLGCVYLLDEKAKAPKEVFERQVPAEAALSIDASLSPLLTHGIFDVQEGKQEYHCILPLDGGPLVAAPDIDQAGRQGLGGPRWSSTGTAVYSADGPVEAAQVRAELADADNLIANSAGSGASSDKRTALAVCLQVTLSVYHQLQLYAPDAGTPVYEVVPTNGVLRPVRSPGPWVPDELAPPKLDTASQNESLSFGPGQGTAKSLWLIDKARAHSWLVAANADTAVLSPKEESVAYTENGALFVRSIGKP